MDSQQMSIFELLNEPYKIKKPIRLIELFAGIGSQAMSLRDLGCDFEHYKVVEFDKYAIKSYNAIHGTDFPTIDITTIHASDLKIVDTNKYTYIMTYSFPCTDLSNAGKGKGMKKGSGTRSGLLWEVERLLNEMDEYPEVLLMENVVNVHSEKHINEFIDWMNFLEKKGYQSYWQDLNAKEIGYPHPICQNRDRCIMVSILGDYSYTFPTKKPLTLRLKDILEDKVDDKYYLSQQIQDRLVITDETFTNNIVGTTKPVFRTIGERDHVYNPNGVMGCLVATDYKQPKQIIEINRLYGVFDDGMRRQAGSVYDKEGLAPTLDCMQGGYRQPLIEEVNEDKGSE